MTETNFPRTIIQILNVFWQLHCRETLGHLITNLRNKKKKTDFKVKFDDLNLILNSSKGDCKRTIDSKLRFKSIPKCGPITLVVHHL